ncbi:MAG: histidine phosphatase family protein [Actinomycetota bacterium]|nr:histidine phosphatase family protein [Actinomycetota bacterium]
MLRLMLFRHGKSDWNTTTRGDRDRPLSPRGERAAATMGLVLRKMGEVPDLVVSSPAVRAEATAALARISGGWDSRLEISDELYGAGPETALGVAARCGGDAERLMLVGHEPTWSLLAERITGGHITVKTATVLAFDLNAASWATVERVGGSLAFALHPRLFTGDEWSLQ